MTHDNDDLGQVWHRMQATAPLVQCITNDVAMNVMANVVLAVGASPAMVQDGAEVADFAPLAQALAVNIGTPHPDGVAAMAVAAAAMAAAGKPWVLDPVAVGATPFRRGIGTRLLACRPTVIRGNASEVLALAGQAAASRGADAGDAVAAAEGAARALATAQGAVVAVSGPVDYVTDGTVAWRIHGGHALMPRVTALGCALNGVIAACVAGQSALTATVAAMAAYGVAGARAGAVAAGPGSFQPAFLDALHALTPADLAASAHVVRA